MLGIKVAMLAFKIFIIIAGIWNICDGIVSIKVTYLGHTKLADFCRLIRTLFGFILVIIGILM
jgi:hypothetical protein